jgi:DegV family protein with EDD domain
MNCKIIADSSSNVLSMEDVDYTSVPLKLITDEKEYVDDANLDVPAMVYELAAYKGRSGSACPSVGEWLEAFGEAENIFTLTITGTLSGCYNASVQAREIYLQEHPERKVCCLDSLSTGPEMALILEKLRELILAGLEFEEVERQIKEYMKHTHLLFMLESVHNMARNGRVSPIVAKAVGVLGIRIVGKASDEGTLQQLHKARGEARGLGMLHMEIVGHGYKGGKIRIAHCMNSVAAMLARDEVLEHYPNADVTVYPLRGLCSFYAERGGVMIGFEDEEA